MRATVRFRSGAISSCFELHAAEFFVIVFAMARVENVNLNAKN